MTDSYILKGHKAIPVEDLFEWERWFKTANRVVKQEILPNRFYVSTIFLGIDHSFGGSKPLLFETMVFEASSRHDLETDRYSTWEEAEEGHKKMVKKWIKK